MPNGSIVTKVYFFFLLLYFVSALLPELCTTGEKLALIFQSEAVGVLLHLLLLPRARWYFFSGSIQFEPNAKLKFNRKSLHLHRVKF